jgi:hypothetical protein
LNSDQETLLIQIEYSDKPDYGETKTAIFTLDAAAEQRVEKYPLVT